MEIKYIQLSEVVKDLNVGINHIVEFLNKKDIPAERNPTFKISLETYDILKKEFNLDERLRILKQKLAALHKRELNNDNIKSEFDKLLKSTIELQEQLSNLTHKNFELILTIVSKELSMMINFLCLHEFEQFRFPKVEKEFIEVLNQLFATLKKIQEFRFLLHRIGVSEKMQPRHLEGTGFNYYIADIINNVKTLNTKLVLFIAKNKLPRVPEDGVHYAPAKYKNFRSKPRDDEDDIMRALQNGDGDLFGF